MAISPLAATPPFPLSVSSVASIEATQLLLARETEADLFLPDSVDSVAFSQTSQLLSSVAEITDAADAAEAGSAIDSSALVEDVQRFVDNANALNFDDRLTTFTLGTVLDISAEIPAPSEPAAQPADVPGIDLVPVGGGGSTFLLTLDSEELQSALAADVVGTTSQLADFVVPLGNAVVQAEINQQLTDGLGGLAVSTETLLASSQTATLLTTSVVPDLTVENAELRQALADTALADILDVVAAGAASLPVQELAAEGVTPPLATNNPPTTNDTAPANAPAAALPAAGALAAPVAAPLPAGADAAALIAAQTATVQAETTMTLAALVTTPLEQIAQLAANPTVAGAVAAFQIPADDGSRGARVAVPVGMDTVNPIAAVLASEGISPNLANTGEQRRDQTPNPRVNQWLATRPGLI